MRPSRDGPAGGRRDAMDDGSSALQVRIGVQNVPKELVVDTAESADEVTDALSAALGDPNGVLVLKDRRSGRIVIPAARVGYLEISEDEQRNVGFGTQYA
ncbi:DUF3107 domain-containing protein [Actinomadura chokoriensis]|uniref:DUF3107 domain-containing protein n=1 Tax=Actinomadura chokoriensis TaxID=454156 RepID=A0ABV4QQX6_9ACTN